MTEGRRAKLLALFLGGAGVTHFAAPEFYDAIVPKALPGTRRLWTNASGVAELVVAALVVRRSTRRVGATLAFLLFVLVFPANVQMAVDWRDEPPARRAASLGRLPLQLPLLVWAWRVRASA